MEDYFAELTEFIRSEKPDKKRLNNKKIELCAKHKIKRMPTDIEVLCNVDSKDLHIIGQYLRTKPTRTASGVAVIAVMAKPFSCPHGRCIYCPGGIGSFFGDVPQSYTGNEPSTMRGIRNDYDPYRIVFNRLEQYIVIGQNPQKTDIIVMGGTFLSFPKDYKRGFITSIFKAMNDFSKEFYSKGSLDIIRFREFFELPGKVDDKDRAENIKKKILILKDKDVRSLEEEKKDNETAAIRCIGLTLETKPDWGLLAHGNEMLDFGVTRVELGIQTVYDDILRKVNRGHGVKEAIDSIRTLKDLGFKLNFHMMPGLPGVTKEKDKDALKQIFVDDDYKPDMLKIYPTLVMPGTPLYDMYTRGEYESITTKDAAELIVDMKRYVPRYCRIMRIQRDIPTKVTKAGVDRTNLRQYVEELQNKKGVVCNCIRCREIKTGKITGKPIIETINYKASGGEEYFISLKDEADKLLGFCRLRFPAQSLRPEITSKSAIIRELHVYGAALGLGEKGKVQHKGFGKQLVEEAESIAKKNKKEKLLIISGVGVKEYYRKIGYKDDGPYVSKMLIVD